MEVRLASKKLEKHFKETLAKIPQDDRQVVESKLRLICDDSNGEYADKLAYVYSHLEGGQIVFLNAKLFARLQPASAQGVIAHELAHVFLWQPEIDTWGANDLEAVEMHELDADELAIKWGFELFRPHEASDFQTDAARARVVALLKSAGITGFERNYPGSILIPTPPHRKRKYVEILPPAGLTEEQARALHIPSLDHPDVRAFIKLATDIVIANVNRQIEADRFKAEGVKSGDAEQPDIDSPGTADDHKQQQP